MKLNIGCGWRDFGKDWIHIDGGNYDHLDSDDIFVTEYKNNSVDLIYASHFIEYFDRDENQINKDIARQYVEQSQLFIEASHSCYANISTEEQ